jgi:hypothetical protein
MCFVSDKQSLLQLPEEVLEQILSNVEEPQLVCVCKLFRKLYYRNITNFTISAHMLCDFCALSFMPNCEILKIISTKNTYEDMETVCQYLPLFPLKKVRRLSFLRFECKDMLEDFVNVLCEFEKLVEIEVLYCNNLCVQDLKYLLKRLPKIKCCNIEIDLHSEADINIFANFANDLSGKVNLNLNNLSTVPKRLLKYPWSAYRVMYPKGQ